MLTLIPVALAALLAGADPGFDTVFLQNGGRVRGTVVEEDPARGVTIQVPGGLVRTVPPGEIFRIEYRDGTVGALGARPPQPATTPPAAAATAPAAAAEPPEPPPGEPAPRAAPPPPPGWSGRPPSEPVRPLNPGPLRPPGPPPPQFLMLSAGMGFMAPSGNAASGYGMSNLTETLFLLNMEAGLRLTPELMIGVYLDLGFGSPGTTERDECRAFNGTGCDALAAKIGLQLRWSMTPRALATPWLAIGIGGEALGVGPSDSSGGDLMYSGREWRLSAGYDWRGHGQVGLGVFMTGAWGTYTHIEDYDGVGFDPVEAGHTWIQAGVRGILFP